MNANSITMENVLKRFTVTELHLISNIIYTLIQKKEKENLETFLEEVEQSVTSQEKTYTWEDLKQELAKKGKNMTVKGIKTRLQMAKYIGSKGNKNGELTSLAKKTLWFKDVNTITEWGLRKLTRKLETMPI